MWYNILCQGSIGETVMKRRQKQRNQNKPKSPGLNLAKESVSELLYVERSIWSPRYKAWSKYYVLKPRLPQPKDQESRWVDNPINAPSSFAGYFGNHNQVYFQRLNHYVESFESSKIFPVVLIAQGDGGTGKSTSVRIFVQRLCDELNLTTNQASKWCLIIDADKFINDMALLWNKITKFSDPPLENYFQARFRLPGD